MNVDTIRGHKLTSFSKINNRLLSNASRQKTLEKGKYKINYSRDDINYHAYLYMYNDNGKNYERFGNIHCTNKKEYFWHVNLTVHLLKMARLMDGGKISYYHILGDLSDLLELVGIKCHLEDFNITRIDFFKDIHVKYHPWKYMDILELIDFPYKDTYREYKNTVHFVGNTDPHYKFGKVYGKSEQMDLFEHMLRFELSIDMARSKHYGEKYLGKKDQRKLVDLHKKKNGEHLLRYLFTRRLFDVDFNDIDFNGMNWEERCREILGSHYKSMEDKYDSSRAAEALFTSDIHDRVRRLEADSHGQYYYNKRKQVEVNFKQRIAERPFPDDSEKEDVFYLDLYREMKEEVLGNGYSPYLTDPDYNRVYDLYSLYKSDQKNTSLILKSEKNS